MTMTHRRLMAALAVLVGTFFLAARAQSFTAFSGPLFSDLAATTLSCSALGLEEVRYDYSRCGVIDDNLVSLNKQIIDRHVRQAGFVVLLPWQRQSLTGTWNHQLGFANFSSGLTYVINYVELSPNRSLVWLTAAW